jgi:F420 biosynthesis protein FbiB-like protein
VISDQLGFYELLNTRHSIRRFTDQPVEASVLDRLLEAACRAPSAHNRQPWRFAVVGEGEARQQLVEAMSSAFGADLQTDQLGQDEVDRLVARGRQRMLGAPVMVVLCLTMEDMDSYPDSQRQQAEHSMAVQSAALAGGHLLLAAHAEGLGGCWVCSPLFAQAVVRQSLDLPADWEPQAMVLLGYPADTGRQRPRKPWKDQTLWR